MFRWSVIHIYLIAYLSYAVMLLLPRDKAPSFVIPFVALYLSSQFMYAMYIDYGGFNMDATTYTMILVTKLWGFSLGYRDGVLKSADLTEEQNLRKIVYLPNLLEYSSYVFFCCGCMCAPFLEFTDFKNWIEFNKHYADLPRGLTNGFKSFKPALLRFG
mmetsp:Transcript_11453/g.19372  ORF Transcript_11453/g.19372 Transcript_11453/m.19372 type:complete len:159 (-) Transcript_11453:823-1299(-)